ncbi:protein FAR1-RELATED SEQUENCE 5-like [Cornus florida]|uniref:protein FAR1-RELATED SEQUENCE 5-like n=1 Tax=Cornus florida TaxID=4283 RepID=UPI00289EE29C|nr:protein FAR1-RELATED SEQUENCE 5-like [Cornus florida]
MEFDSEEEAYDFYNAYGGRIGFSIRKEYGNKVNGRITSRVLVCSKEGVKGIDKRDVFRKTPRTETRTNCSARMVIRYDKTKVIDVELASDSGVPACNAYELMGRQSGGKESIGLEMLSVSTQHTKWYTVTDHLQFLGMNHHRETAVFGVALMYDETADSFVWLFETFLKVMGGKAPKTIVTDQDAAMAKALKQVMPMMKHHLCVWHLMNNE